MDIAFSQFLIGTLIAAESLLISAFMGLYSVYASYMLAGQAGICAYLRGLCVLLSIIIILAAVVDIYANHSLANLSSEIPSFIILGLDVIAGLIPIPAVVITWRMRQDAAP